MSIKNKIKAKLTKWLEIDDLNSNLINVSKDFNTYKIRNNSDIQRIIKYANDLENKYDSLHNTVQECVTMGADICRQPNRDGSWAVVCFKRGNTNIVKFIDLRGCDGREMYEYLKRYDSSRYKIDAPYGMIDESYFCNWNHKRLT